MVERSKFPHANLRSLNDVPRLSCECSRNHAVSPPFSPAGNAAMLWCACSTSIFKSVTSRFIKNLACSGMCAGLACVPFDIALGVSPRCCWWLHTLVICKAVKFLQKLYCSVTVLSFSAIALDRLAWKPTRVEN